jgi:hypothetical protein
MFYIMFDCYFFEPGPNPSQKIHGPDDGGSTDP